MTLQTWIGVIAMVAVAGLVFFYWHQRQLNRAGRKPRAVVFIIALMSGMSLAMYAGLGEADFAVQSSQQLAQQSDDNAEFAGLTASEVNQKRITMIQESIKANKQNGELWYALGNAYMYDNAFDQAVIAFDYSRRLAPAPQANIYSALASALYYQQGQRMTADVSQWLDKALELDKDNFAALTLIGSDYFMSARYQKAIDTWVQILDSEHPDADRPALIAAINRAKQLL
ncbi:hypothetical protein A3K86_14235 [Photobacterium jeanii]|uniref:Cytochrome c-type biogenesis protein H TPR domain-containing protein n=1 Tax=Photobacterium jeanii TaxID=858640 RepID=A0A178KAI8_9GAMM|nr:hypothetical protein [Photobacterium jeanii]OAN13724.1 hypothetical protein A3K86_14235 [Photobacterium jeanii]PST88845.1 nitrite reductase [Photobacterium jeanii]